MKIRTTAAIILASAVIATTLPAEPLMSEDESLSRIVEVIERPAQSADLKMRDYERAIVMLDRFDRDYDSPQGHATAAFLRGGSYMGLGRYGEALAKLDEAVSGPLSDDFVPVAYYLKGRILLEQGDQRDGIEALQTAIAKNPSHEVIPNVRFILAHGLIEMSRTDEARAQVDTILANGASGWVLQGATMLRDNLRFIGSSAPDFTATTLDGSRIRLSDYRGSVVLVDFWASWCPPCIAALPDVQRIYSEYRRQGFKVVGISMDRSRGALDNFLRTNNMPWTHVYEGAREIAELYDVTGIPKTILIDRVGNVIAVDPSAERLEAILNRRLIGN